MRYLEAGDFDGEQIIVARDVLEKLYNLYHVLDGYHDPYLLITADDDELLNRLAEAIEPFEAEIAKVLAG